MKFENINIGGKEIGSVNVSFSGDMRRARDHEGYGLALLGAMKQRMALAQIKSLAENYTLGPLQESNSLLYYLQIGDLSVSNMSIERAAVTMVEVTINVYIYTASAVGEGSMADTDQLTIHVETEYDIKLSQFKCHGYILRVYENDLENPYDLHLTLPKGQTLNFDYYEIVDRSSELKFADYPDNGAKYNNTLKSEFKEVLVADYEHTFTYNYGGPTTYTLPPSPGIPSADGWTLSPSNQYSSGSCGSWPSIPPLPLYWEEYTVYLCIGTLKVGGLITQDDGTKKYEYRNVSVTQPGWYFTGGHHIDIFPRCERDGSHPGLPPPPYDYHSWLVWSAMFPAIVELGAKAYESQLQPDGGNKYYYRLAGLSSILISDLIKREDDKGFCGLSGFYLNNKKFNDIVFTEAGAGNGECCLFMMPDRGKLKYSYDSSVRSKLPEKSETTREFYVNETVGYMGGTCGWYTSYLQSERHVSTVTLVDTYSMVEKFGIPVEVDYGIHKIRCTGSPYKVDVYLQIEDTNTGAIFIPMLTFDGLSDGSTINVLVGDISGDWPSCVWIN